MFKLFTAFVAAVVAIPACAQVAQVSRSSEGFIGIGTANPANPLDVVGGVILRAAPPLIPSLGVGPYLHIGFDSANSWGYIGTHNGGLIGNALRIDTAVLAINTNPNSGNVGIKVTNPSYTLQVNGSVAGTLAYANTADFRVQKDIEPLTYGMNAVMRLRPVSFYWTNQDQDWKNPKQIGLIAQDVELVIPEVVTAAKDSMKTKSIAYGELVPVLVKALQDLRVDNQVQADAIADLRREFEEYKKAHP